MTLVNYFMPNLTPLMQYITQQGKKPKNHLLLSNLDTSTLHCANCCRWLTCNYRPFSRTTWESWHEKGKPFWITMKQEMMGGRGISWTICKSSAPHSR